LNHPGEAETLDLEAFPGNRVVVKVAAADVAHKTGLGGVVVCKKQREELCRAVREVAERFSAGQASIAVNEFVPHDEKTGGELLVGLRATPDYGPVAILGPGGVETERLSVWELLCVSASGRFWPRLERAVRRHDLARYLSEPYRGRQARIPHPLLEDLLSRVLDLGRRFMPPLADFEINPPLGAYR
jgi:hypothetical protein